MQITTGTITPAVRISPLLNYGSLYLPVSVLRLAEAHAQVEVMHLPVQDPPDQTDVVEEKERVMVDSTG
jgi:hypothetical protein